MQLWKSILAYDGTNFHGWQVQPGLPTVQGTLAQALHHITGETVLPQGSGRTDTGVHALAQVATFALAAPIPPQNLHRALNRALPPSIRILSVNHAPDHFHARHSALCKTYEYRLFPRVVVSKFGEAIHPGRICPPFLAPYAWDFPFPFSLLAANESAAHILGTHDFTSFAASDPDLTTRTADVTLSQSPKTLPYPESSVPPNARTIHSSTWHQDPQSCLYTYRVNGSGFLHHMVRNLVGTFAEAACGRVSPASIPSILDARDRSAAGPTAPARGLFLVEVEYPEVEPQ